MSSELAKVNGDQSVDLAKNHPDPTIGIQGPHPFLLADGCPVPPDPPFLHLAQVGISFEDIRDGLLFLLGQKAEVQQSLSFGSWSMCHGEGGQGPKPLLRWVASLGHQLGLCPSWAYVASCRQTKGCSVSLLCAVHPEASCQLSPKHIQES